jgi:sulfide dehydrogenase cytochrome subunit
MKLFRAMLALLMVALWWPYSFGAEASTARGGALIRACAACHGPDGRSQGMIPSIDQLPAEDFTAALQAFRTGTRQGTVMNRIARGVDDAEISAMAAYVAARRGR